MKKVIVLLISIILVIILALCVIIALGAVNMEDNNDFATNQQNSIISFEMINENNTNEEKSSNKIATNEEKSNNNEEINSNETGLLSLLGTIGVEEDTTNKAENSEEDEIVIVEAKTSNNSSSEVKQETTEVFVNTNTNTNTNNNSNNNNNTSITNNTSNTNKTNTNSNVNNNNVEDWVTISNIPNGNGNNNSSSSKISNDDEDIGVTITNIPNNYSKKKNSSNENNNSNNNSNISVEIDYDTNKQEDNKEQERKEQERKEQERKEQERKEQERKEQERKEQERKEQERKELEQIVSDTIIMPDKYNTGIVSNDQKIFIIGDELAGFLVQESPKGVAVINFYHKQNISKENVYIENMDFSNYDFRFYNHGTPDHEIKITFYNCIFGSIGTPVNCDDKISFYFNNCSIRHHGGSNATFDRCKFEGHVSDGMNPNKNVTVKNSYFYVVDTYTSKGEAHYDGVHMFGCNSAACKGLPVENIYFYNTRFETPYFSEKRDGVTSTSYVNASIMFALEYSNGNNIVFENIYANGGGYSIYAGASKGMSYTNAIFKDVKVGYGHLYGILYPMKEQDKENTTFINFGHYDKLLVGSVWKDDNGVHISTTNDTLIERELTCVTNKGTYVFKVNAHPKLSKKTAYDYTFYDMPYDINETIEKDDILYVKCYDTTETNELTDENLIRTQRF